MAKTCLKHKDQPAVTMCHQCHAPICKSCVTVTPQGSFCSSECNLINREMRMSLRPPPEKGLMAKKALLVVMTLCALLFVIHFLARGTHFFRKFDIIGKYMRYPDDDSGPIRKK